MNKPWMKFYPSDWQSDEGLRQCSLLSRGLWIEMIAVMHKSAVYGHLLIAGLTPSEGQIATAVAADVKAVRGAIAELEKWNVFSRTEDGVIYSRRMVSDAEKADKDVENGRGGGNPALKGTRGKGVNPPVIAKVNQAPNPTDNGVDKAQILEARTREESKKEPPVQPPSEPATVASRPAPPTRVVEARGVRLPEDWQPSAADRAFANSLGVDPDAVAAEFRAYWLALPGVKGRKAGALGWSMTFQNRCRDRAARHKPLASPSHTQRRPAQNGAIELMIQARERASDLDDDRTGGLRIAQ